MRPPICPLCRAREEDRPLEGGDWVAFADYTPLPRGMTGHPQGLEWFCAVHLKRAQALLDLPTRAALEQLHLQAESSAGWWSRLREWLARRRQ